LEQIENSTRLFIGGRIAPFQNWCTRWHQGDQKKKSNAHHNESKGAEPVFNKIMQTASRNLSDTANRVEYDLKVNENTPVAPPRRVWHGDNRRHKRLGACGGDDQYPFNAFPLP